MTVTDQVDKPLNETESGDDKSIIGYERMVKIEKSNTAPVNFDDGLKLVFDNS